MDNRYYTTCSVATWPYYFIYTWRLHPHSIGDRYRCSDHTIDQGAKSSVKTNTNTPTLQSMA